LICILKSRVAFVLTDIFVYYNTLKRFSKIYGGAQKWDKSHKHFQVFFYKGKDIDGRRFCNWVIGNKMFNNLPIILLTHDKFEQKNKKDQTYVGCNCIQLPFNPNNLLELVEGLLTELET